MGFAVGKYPRYIYIYNVCGKNRGYRNYSNMSVVNR